MVWRASWILGMDFETYPPFCQQENSRRTPTLLAFAKHPLFLLYFPVLILYQRNSGIKTFFLWKQQIELEIKKSKSAIASSLFCFSHKTTQIFFGRGPNCRKSQQRLLNFGDPGPISSFLAAILLVQSNSCMSFERSFFLSYKTKPKQKLYNFTLSTARPSSKIAPSLNSF